MTPRRATTPRLAPRAALALAFAALSATAAAGQPELVPPDPATFRAYDRPSDDGSTIAVEWGLSPSEADGVSYILEIATEAERQAGTFKPAARFPAKAKLRAEAPKYFGFSSRNKSLHYVGVAPARLYRPDPKAIRAELEAAERARLKEGAVPGKKFATYVSKLLPKRLSRERRRVNAQTCYFRLAITDGQSTAYVSEGGQPKVVSARARVNYFKRFKVNNLVFSLVFCGIVMAFIQLARRNPNLYIRKIAGLEAVEEDIGRATEMGRSAFFVHGLTGMGSLSTIAAVNILGRVARRAAEYDTRVRVMNRDPIVMAVSQEVVKQSYTEAGRPDAYDDDDVALVASDQFSYVAAVGGRMLRERPAAIFLMGYFYAESLLLSETGASTGAIQIAGTDSYTQIPFFVTTCDYTLIGEELYAASAYLSREPRMLGSLRGQDVGKAFLMAVIVLFALLATAGKLAGWDLWWIQTLFQPFS